jgi:uncharacterized membrane protein
MRHWIARYATTLGALLVTAAALGACSDAGQAPTAPKPGGQAAEAAKFWAPTPTFVTFDVPGATGTTPLDINAFGDIVGRYAAGGLTHGFLRKANGAFTTIDYPGALFTSGGGINAEGDLVGWYSLAAVQGPMTERHGFLLHHGTFTPIDPDGSKFTNPLGIDWRGDVVGRYCTALPCGKSGAGNYHGFRWHNGVATTIDVPGSRETNAWKINTLGDIVGGYREDGGPNRLFTLRGATFRTFDLPGAQPVTQDNGGINPWGDIVGVYCDAAPCDLGKVGSHGFRLRLGAITTIDYPGAIATSALGINLLGEIAGGFTDASGVNHGYVLRNWP